MKFNRKYMKWGGWILVSPFILFILLSILIYLPPVQRFLVDRAIVYAREEWGIDVSIEEISLSFPLDLTMHRIVAIQEGDTLLQAQDVTVSVQMLPLIEDQVVIDKFLLKGIQLNTARLIDGVLVKGSIQHLQLQSDTLSLAKQIARLHDTTLSDAELFISYADTVPADTAKSDPVLWKIDLHQLALRNVKVQFTMPLDTINVQAEIKEATLHHADLDLATTQFTARQLHLLLPALEYHSSTTTPADKGFDASHIRFAEIESRVDSLTYSSALTALSIQQLTLTEHSGIRLVQSKGRFEMDTLQVRIPWLSLTTEDSHVYGNAVIGLQSNLHTEAQTVKAQLQAQIGKDDVLRLMPDLAEEWRTRYPSAPLRIIALADGNWDALRVSRLEASLGNALQLEAKGDLSAVTDSLRRNGALQVNISAPDPSFLQSFTNGVTIPRGITLNGTVGWEGSQFYTDLLLKEAGGTLALQGAYDLSTESYEGKLSANQLNIDHFLPGDSLYYLTATAEVEGKGLDFLAAPTGMGIRANVDSLLYGSKYIKGVSLDANLKEQQLLGTLSADNELMKFSGEIKATMSPKEISGFMNLSVAYLDWVGLRLSEVPLSSSQDFAFNFYTDFKHTHRLKGDMTNVHFITPEKTYRAKDLHTGLFTTTDSLHCFVNAGDLYFLFRAAGNTDKLSGQLAQLSKEWDKQWAKKRIDNVALQRLLPTAELRIFSEKDNPLYNFLATKQVYFSRIDVEMTLSPEKGLNGYGRIFDLKTDSIWLDTVQVRSYHQDEKMLINGLVKAEMHKGQEAFEIRSNGEIAQNEGLLNVQYFNQQREKGADIGIKALLEEKGVRFQLLRNNPTLVYRTFTANDDNYVFFHTGGRIDAKMRLHDAQGSGIAFYSIPDSLSEQDLTLSLNNIHLGEFRRIIPYMPQIEGTLNGDAHYVLKNKSTLISTEMSLTDFQYNQENMGNWAMSAVYLPKESGEHRIDGYVVRNDKEVATLNGSYFAPLRVNGKAGISADVTLTEFPLEVSNPFIPEKYAQLTGNLNGTMTMAGATDRLLLNGEVGLDKVDMRIPKLSMHLQFDRSMVSVEDSRVFFKEYKVYSQSGTQNTAQGGSPFVLDGSIDIRNMANPVFDLTMGADNFQLVNAKKSRGAMLYGKVLVDFHSTLKGPMTDLNMRGNLHVLGESDFTYVLDNTPLTVENRLGSTVTFVSLADTAQVEKKTGDSALPTNLSMVLGIHIDDAVQCRANINTSGSNYLLVEGGGNLTFQYLKDGSMKLQGRYSVNSGEMKYELPVIPLKTFQIQQGSYILWTGNVMNPQLNISVYETVRASVSQSGLTARSVKFNVGMDITQTVENMGFTFTLDAPEDGAMQSELATKSKEEKNKLAVTMLVTGMYLAENNTTSSLSTSSALNAFLQSEINNIAGSALKTIDLNVEMNNTDLDGDGNAETNYNFQFAKRFWNNRIRVLIGGTVATGNNAAQSSQSFINNVSLEYRLDNGGTRYIRLFYDKNYESLLDGEITEAGVGLVLKKKVSRLSDLFIFRRKKKPSSQ